jgi:hypothetical protein
MRRSPVVLYEATSGAAVLAETKQAFACGAHESMFC